MKAYFLPVLFLVSWTSAAGQADSTVVAPGDPVTIAPGAIVQGGADTAHSTMPDTLGWRYHHSPTKACVLSAVLPGAGQIYNRKYWKAPIVWAGLGISFWFVQSNSKEYRRYKDNYIAVVDGDPTTIDEFNGEVSASQLLDATDTYRKWRDMSYIALGLVYMLNIVDAGVDANFVRFDVGRDLTVGMGPSLEMAAQGNAGLHLSLALR
ncbi:MAG TPA: DUF5683 domain-containing protein [Flavobacteriales bacterium]|nr:DUF5683 domain-containing protein [Flavobacteriales bacterium]